MSKGVKMKVDIKINKADLDQARDEIKKLKREIQAKNAKIAALIYKCDELQGYINETLNDTSILAIY